MSGETGSWAGIVLGVLVGVFAVATGQYYLLFTAAMLVAGGAVGLAYAPKSDSQQNAQAQELKIASAATGMPVPVVFGVARVTPNWLRFSDGAQGFRADAVEAESSGGKGGGGGDSQIIGYKYYLAWEQGYCMGPIDAVGQIYSMPGEVPMVSSPTGWIYFEDDDYVDLLLGLPLVSSIAGGDSIASGLAAAIVQSAQSDAEEGGMVRIYKGSSTQIREAAGDPYASNGLNYRHLSWMLVGLNQKFLVGPFPQPRTYQMMIHRLSKCVRDDLTTVDEINTRGSTDDTHEAYMLANPAAMVYEIITNKVWGRQLPSDIIDEDSFASVSDYLAEHNLGLSILLERPDNVGDVLQGIFRHCKTIILWDGEQYKLVCLLDQSVTHANIITLRDADIISFKVNTPLWDGGTVNELRGEFTASDRAYRPDVVHAQDLANLDILEGRTVSERISLQGFTNYSIAQQQLNRILSEMSYPFMSAEWEMNRFNSHVSVGSVVRVIWDAFTSQPITTYWMIVRIGEGGSGSENIKVTAVQDQLLFPVEGEETEVEIPSLHPWERTGEAAAAQVHLNDDDEVEPETLYPVTFFEAPAIATLGQSERAVIIGRRPPQVTLGTQGLWSLDEDEFFDLGTTKEFAITGRLATAMPGGEYWNRSHTGYEFTTIDNSIADLAGVNAVQSDSGHLERLLFLGQHWIIIGDELMQVGLIEFVSTQTVLGLTTWTFRMRNIIRGRFGTRIVSHPADTDIFYAANLAEGVDSSDIPKNQSIWFMALPVGRRGVAASQGFALQPYHDAPNNGKYLGRGVRPLPPEIISTTRSGEDVTIIARPRLTNTGAGVADFFEVLQNPIGSIGDMSFAAYDPLMDATVGIAHVFTPATLTTPGYVTLTFTRSLAGSRHWDIYSRVNGKQSVTFTTATLPIDLL